MSRDCWARGRSWMEEMQEGRRRWHAGAATTKTTRACGLSSRWVCGKAAQGRAREREEKLGGVERSSHESVYQQGNGRAGRTGGGSNATTARQ